MPERLGATLRRGLTAAAAAGEALGKIIIQGSKTRNRRRGGETYLASVLRKWGRGTKEYFYHCRANPKNAIGKKTKTTGFAG